jgi:hypothetical protein
MIVQSANAPNAIPPTTATTMIAVFVPPEMPDLVPSEPAAAAEAVEETEAVLTDTEPVRAPRVVPDEVGTRDEVSVTVERMVETS